MASETRPHPIEIVLGAHVERIKEQELQSFEELYRLTRDEVVCALFHMAEPGADLERLVADVYAVFFEELRELPPGAPVRPALHRVCAKVALRRRSSLGRRDRSLGSIDLRRDRDAHELAASKLHRALRRLSARQRVAFVLDAVMGLPAREAAAAMGYSRDALSRLLRQARLGLSAALQNDQNPEDAAEVTP